MTILLFGANGQVGHELRSALSVGAEVVALGRTDANFSKPKSLSAIVRRYSPTVVVNAVAYTAVDKAERDECNAVTVNATAPGVLAEAAEDAGAIFVHYSTDYVFDGTSGRPYRETDEPNPVSVYGRSKRAGELVSRSCQKCLIFRTSWVFGAHGHNFAKTMLRLGSERQSLRVVDDQIGAPTSARLIADVTANVLAQMIGKPAADHQWGLYHLTAGGATSWHGLACHVIAKARAMGVPLRMAPENIEPIGTAEYPTPARRPANSRLATSKLQQTFSVALPDWAVGVDAVLRQLIPEMSQ